MKTPSIVGETSAIITVITFLMWTGDRLPKYLLFIPIVFGLIFILDWMLGGIADKGLCKKCF